MAPERRKFSSDERLREDERLRPAAQARGFAVDPARVRSPQDKGRVESGVT